MDKTSYNFNKYSLYAFLILGVIPFISLLLPKSYPSFFETFDKLSVPLWIGLYSYFWLRYSRGIKKTEQKVLTLKQRDESYKRINNPDYSDQQNLNSKELKECESYLREAKPSLEFINNALRFSAIIAALIKFVGFAYDVIKLSILHK